MNHKKRQMKKYLGFSIFLVVLIVTVVACSKKAVVANNTYPPSNGAGSNLFPFKAGSVWIYQDSLWDSTKTLSKVFADTAYISNNTLRFDLANGGLLYNFIDPKGVFGSCYFGTSTDVNGNGIIIELDYGYSKPYIFFGTATNGDSSIGTWKDASNAACTYNYQQFAFTTSTKINGYNCYKNIITTTNCNNINTENFVEYVSPGVGIVRLENWKQDTTGINKPLYLDYSQTLQQYIP